jgi:hypothetical protein
VAGVWYHPCASARGCATLKVSAAVTRVLGCEEDCRTSMRRDGEVVSHLAKTCASEARWGRSNLDKALICKSSRWGSVFSSITCAKFGHVYT